MRRLTRKLIWLLIGLLIMTSISACGEKKNTANNSGQYKYGKLKIQALGGGVCGAPSYIAYEKGFFKEEGLDVELVSGTLDEDKAGLQTGEYTVTNGDFQWFPSIQQGMDLKIIGGLHHGCIKLVVPPNSPIKSVSDLKGKKIGVDEIGGTPMAITSVALANAGIDPQKEVQWITYPLDQLTQAVDKGEVDAFAAWDPFGTLAVKNNNYKVLVDIGKDPLFAGKTCCFLYASKKQIDANPDKVAAIARAYQKACEWISKNPEETAKIEIEKKYVPTNDLNLVTELIKSYDYHYTTGDVLKNEIKYFVEQLSKTGYIKKDTDAEEFTQQVYYDVFKNR
ncbi:ABC transporter substrate-binding protein [Thermoanaerobacterium thermosaccharolyticum]|uniref:ABC-type nitrate/sulfonate/bicarbonate transport system, periplasmic component n=1 Tax=Thermoanaerobacterium thermosaccharolyticum M0795 TaxID=698948 RepID=L0IML0_THETR|nr:ABC transporter substrate-binding protein [Thermoanaerobacterium thermosaccharolyticum]AGB19207.1 ABC-type nitrate/sulfonate/bicarbonate transport system, periplasmic component [Thermoanaerobacterium thermosaccharolyticum M0795]